MGLKEKLVANIVSQDVAMKNFTMWGNISSWVWSPFSSFSPLFFLGGDIFSSDFFLIGHKLYAASIKYVKNSSLDG